MSVSLALIETDPPHSSHADLMSYWNESFGHSESDEEKSSANKQKPGDEPGETERRTPPRRIDGIGDDACWLSSRYSGALYVLKGDVIIRVSVGGPNSEEAKIGKSKLLAEKALARL